MCIHPGSLMPTLPLLPWGPLSQDLGFLTALSLGKGPPQENAGWPRGVSKERLLAMNARATFQLLNLQRSFWGIKHIQQYRQTKNRGKKLEHSSQASPVKCSFPNAALIAICMDHVVSARPASCISVRAVHSWRAGKAAICHSLSVSFSSLWERQGE